MRNVRCAGGGEIARDPAPFGLGPTHYKRATNGEPCGWKGERYNLTEPRFAYRETYFGEEQSPHPAWVRALTAKPCPLCGGRVELIPEEP